jgi:hypothetical protein
LIETSFILAHFQVISKILKRFKHFMPIANGKIRHYEYEHMISCLIEQLWRCSNWCLCFSHMLWPC